MFASLEFGICKGFFSKKLQCYVLEGKKWWIWLLAKLWFWWGKDVDVWCETAGKKLHIVGLLNLPQCDVLFSVMNKKRSVCNVVWGFFCCYHCLQQEWRFGQLTSKTWLSFACVSPGTRQPITAHHLFKLPIINHYSSKLPITDHYLSQQLITD